MGAEADHPRAQALEALGHAVDAWPEGGAAAWQAASRTACDGIWVLWEAVEHAPKPVARYRGLRPETRIVVEIPDDLAPPHAEVAAWVALGVYDWVRADAETATVLAKPATVADALPWSGLDGLEWEEPAASVKVVEKKVPLTNRPALVAVWGAVPGVGTTTLAWAIGHVLSEYGDTAVLDHALPVDRHGVPVEGETGLTVLTRRAPERPGLTAWPVTWELPSPGDPLPRPVVPGALEAMRMRRWAYVVVDAGVAVEGASAPLWQQADLNIVLLPAASTRMAGCWHWIGRDLQANLGFVAAAFGPRWAAALTEENAGAAVAGLPWPGEPGHAEAVEALVAPVLPEEPARVRRQRRRQQWLRVTRKAAAAAALAVGAWVGWIHVGPAISHWIVSRW